MPFHPGKPYQSRRPVFTPYSLGPILVLDASVPESIKTSNAGTGAISDTAALGYWGDVSSRGNDIISAADNTTRPTWNANAGLPYVNFDGTDDQLKRSARIGLYHSGACSIFMAARSNNGGANKFLFGERSSTGNALYQIWEPGQPTTANIIIANDASSFTLAINACEATNVWDNADTVVGFTDDGSTMLAYEDGALVDSQTYTRSGTLSLDRLFLGGVLDTPADWTPARIYAITVIPRVINSGERADLVRWLAAKQGRILTS